MRKYYGRICFSCIYLVEWQLTWKAVNACVTKGMMPPPGWTTPAMGVESVFSPTTRDLGDSKTQYFLSSSSASTRFNCSQITSTTDMATQPLVLFTRSEHQFMYTLFMRMHSAPSVDRQFTRTIKSLQGCMQSLPRWQKRMSRHGAMERPQLQRRKLER
jgi:hypothetical protein